MAFVGEYRKKERNRNPITPTLPGKIFYDLFYTNCYKIGTKLNYFQAIPRMTINSKKILSLKCVVKKDATSS